VSLSQRPPPLDLDLPLHLGGARPACVACAAGRWDHDGSGATPCRSCRAGFYSPRGSTICVDVRLSAWYR